MDRPVSDVRTEPDECETFPASSLETILAGAGRQSRSAKPPGPFASRKHCAGHHANNLASRSAECGHAGEGYGCYTVWEDRLNEEIASNRRYGFLPSYRLAEPDTPTTWAKEKEKKEPRNEMLLQDGRIPTCARL